MKKCCICKKEKSLDQFNKNKRREDGLNTVCKECSREKSKEYYTKNKQKHLNYVKSHKNKDGEKKKAFIKSCKTFCCICGETEKCCLDLHHLKPENKSFTLSRYGIGVSPLELIEEIEKCVVVCANCHRKIHNNLVDTKNLETIKLSEDSKRALIERKKYIKTYKEKPKRICIICNKNEVKQKKSTQCFECRCNNKQVKYTYPSDDVLRELLQHSYLAVVAQNLNISYRALRKHCKKRKLI